MLSNLILSPTTPVIRLLPQPSACLFDVYYRCNHTGNHVTQLTPLPGFPWISSFLVRRHWVMEVPTKSDRKQSSGDIVISCIGRENRSIFLTQELLEAIIDCLSPFTSELRPCALVSKSWVTRAQSHLFRTVSLMYARVRGQGTV
jgi:hypothetical protein